MRQVNWHMACELRRFVSKRTNICATAARGRYLESTCKMWAVYWNFSHRFIGFEQNSFSYNVSTSIFLVPVYSRMFHRVVRV